MLIGREHVDDPVHRLGRIAGVQGRQHKMAGFRRSNCDADCFHVAHLADQDDVGILPQRRPQRVGKSTAIGADLPLVDNALAVPVQIFDRVLQRQDVAGTFTVDQIDHRRHRGRLAAAGGSGDQHQAARLAGQFTHDVRQFQFLQARHPLGNDPDRNRNRTALPERIDAKPAEAEHRIGKIDFAVLIELDAPVFGDNLLEQLRGIVHAKRWQIKLDQRAIDPDQRRHSHRHMQVGRMAGNRFPQQRLHVHRIMLPFRDAASI